MTEFSVNVSNLGKVAVIMGCYCSEREVSLISGAEVLKALISAGVNAHKIDFIEGGTQQLIDGKFDRAFIVLHGRNGEDGVVQGLLETLQIPYTGSGVMASALAMDKYRTKLLWQSVGIPLASSIYLERGRFNKELISLTGLSKLGVQLPVVVKPARDGSTQGLTKVYDAAQLESAVEVAFKCGDGVLIENLIEGDEYTLTLDEKNFYPFVKIEAPQGNYDYQNKYFTDDVVYLCPYELDDGLTVQIQNWARLAYQTIGARGVVRVDFMIDKHSGRPYFLEINTIPGMTTHSLSPMAFKASGVNFTQFCLHLLSQAKLDSKH